jgi:bile acid-coenzyme A ligase
VAQMSISRCITELARREPDRPAITDRSGTTTRGELDLRTNRLARDYARRGVTTGSMVTIALPNGRQFYEACIAAWKLGATAQPVSARLPAAEREAVIELADPVLVVGAEVEGRSCIAAGHEPDADLDDAELPDAVAAEWKAPTSGGSTGRPKLIVSREPGVFDPDEAGMMLMQGDDVQLVPGPLYHNGPFIFSFRGLFVGHHLVVMERFDAEEALRLIDEHRVGFVMMVPTMMQRIHKLPVETREAHDVSSLHTVLHLAAPCPPWLKRAWIEWLGPETILELYAGTEANGLTIIRGDEWLERPGSVGRAIGCELRILHPETHEELAPGEVGEVFMRAKGGAGSTYRYIGDRAKVVDGFDTIGDLGWVDEDGYLFLADRRTDLIISGGANIFPAEIEAAIDRHPQVRSSAVIGLPDDDLGQRAHAIVDATGPLSEQELREHLGDLLARYKVPRTFELTDEGPLRGDDGKVRRSQLREERLARVEEADSARA